MKRLKYKRRIGSLALLFLLLGLSTAAWSYAGNVFILKTEYDAAGGASALVGVYAGTKPDQDGNGATRTLTLGETGANYKIYPSPVVPTATWNPSGLQYINIIIYDSLNNPAWVLMQKSGGGPSGSYGTIRADLGETVPTDVPVNSIAWYYKGPALSPGSLVVTPGYEVAKGAWILDSNYDYDSVEVQLTTSTGTVIDAINDEGAHSAITTITGRAQKYLTGQLIDGRVLNVASPYVMKVRGNVAGPYDSDWANQSFSTLSAAAGGGGPVPINIARRTATGLGISSFAVPNVTAALNAATRKIGTGGIEDRLASVTTRTLRDGHGGLDLVNMLNQTYGGAFVRTIGKWNESGQVEEGAIINYDSGTTINAASIAEIDRILPRLEPGKGYQVFVRPDTDNNVDVTLTLQ